MNAVMLFSVQKMKDIKDFLRLNRVNAGMMFIRLMSHEAGVTLWIKDKPFRTEMRRNLHMEVMNLWNSLYQRPMEVHSKYRSIGLWKLKGMKDHADSAGMWHWDWRSAAVLMKSSSSLKFPNGLFLFLFPMFLSPRVPQAYLIHDSFIHWGSKVA